MAPIGLAYLFVFALKSGILKDSGKFAEGFRGGVGCRPWGYGPGPPVSPPGLEAKQKQPLSNFSLVHLHRMGRQETFRVREPLSMVLERLSWVFKWFWGLFGVVWPPLPGPLYPPGPPGPPVLLLLALLSSSSWPPVSPWPSWEPRWPGSKQETAKSLIRPLKALIRPLGAL